EVEGEQVGEAPGDGKSEPRMFAAGSRQVFAPEANEEKREVVGLELRREIRDLQVQGALRVAVGAACDPRAGRAVFDGVRKEVRQDAFELRPIGGERGTRGDLAVEGEAALGGGRGKRCPA